MAERDDALCCPEFDPELWDGKKLEWRDRLFVKDSVRQFLHVPISVSKVIGRMHNKVAAANAEPDEFLLLSYDPSPWESELYYAVSKKVPGADNVKLNGTYLTKVFDGPFNACGRFIKEMDGYVKNQGKETKKTYLYFTTCPRCADYYGHNYIVAFAEV